MLVAVFLVALMAALPSGCDRRQRPSFVLFVLDTSRADAVSAYGRVKDTTPTVDALAHGGLRYAHAYSNSSWTLPSHASMFTGLLPSWHGVQLGVDSLRPAVATLAEQLRANGYETVGFSENPWLTEATGLQRGFERFNHFGGDMLAAIADWLRTRPRDRPFFLFVNVLDPHWAYAIRDENPFVPPGVTVEQLQALSRDSGDYLCASQTDSPEIALLWGLYLGEMRAADAKLARVLTAANATQVASPLIVIVTADHGEYFGEHGFVEHFVSLGEPVLRVPLVVNGVPGAAPAVVDTPVQLADVMPSILTWAGLPVPDGLSGKMLPTRSAVRTSASPIVAEFTDSATHDAVKESIRVMERRRRRRCNPPADRVFGDVRTIVDYPYKLVWYADYPAALFDLSKDPGEQMDLAATSPAIVQALRTKLEKTLAGVPTPGRERALATMGPALEEHLRALGYLGGETQPAPQ